MSQKVLSNEDIDDVEALLKQKIQFHNDQSTKFQREVAELEEIKFQGRDVLVKPAQTEEIDDPHNPGKKIDVITRRAVKKIVYDIPPKSKDDPSVDLPEETRKKRFNEIKKSI